MTFEDRLENYVTTPTASKTRKGADGLTGPQRRRLLKKDRHQRVRSTEGETTR